MACSRVWPALALGALLSACAAQPVPPPVAGAPSVSVREAPAGIAAADAQALQPIELAAGVFMLQGSGGEPEPTNLGWVGNAGFIVGRSGVMAIDTGTSYRQGRALLAAIRSVTPLPVRLALITHARQEFLFGAAAFREQGIPIAMHQAAAGLMVSRCETCLKRLRGEMGEQAMEGTQMPQPDIRFAQARDLNAAALIGRSLQLLDFGHSSGPGDVVVFDPRTGTLFAGGLIDAQQIPDVGDSELPAWQEALRNLQALPVEVIVPGHGPAGDKRLISQTQRYLSQLDARAQALLAQGAPLSEVADASALTDFAGWALYDTMHRRNAAIIYLRHERAQLLAR